MKKAICLIVSVTLIAALTACGSAGNGNRTGNTTATVSEVLKEQAAKTDSASSDAGSISSVSSSSKGFSYRNPDDTSQSEAVSASSAKGTDGIDVDLTALSSTMIYSEVYNMMYMPEEYIGKSVKMNGAFAFYHDEATDNYYFACIVKDATACCSQGIEFILSADYVYPDDYPEPGEEITVTGIFDTYTEGEYQYCTLRDAQLI